MKRPSAVLAFLLTSSLIGLLSSCNTYSVRVSDPNELYPLKELPEEITSGIY